MQIENTGKYKSEKHIGKYKSEHINRKNANWKYNSENTTWENTIQTYANWKTKIVKYNSGKYRSGNTSRTNTPRKIHIGKTIRKIQIGKIQTEQYDSENTNKA